MQTQLKVRRLFVNPIYKDRVRVLKTSEETGGEYSLGELEIAPGGGNSLHTHAAFEETFTAMEGTLGVKLNKRLLYLKPGMSVTVPLKTPHHFFNSSEVPVKCQVKFIPGHDNFIKGLAIGYGLAADGKTNKKGMPKSLMHLALLISLTDTRPAGIIGLLFPVFRWMAGKARKNGTEKHLLEKYYYE